MGDEAKKKETLDNSDETVDVAHERTGAPAGEDLVDTGDEHEDEDEDEDEAGKSAKKPAALKPAAAGETKKRAATPSTKRISDDKSDKES